MNAKPQPATYRILRPFTPGVFAATGSQDQNSIAEACDAQGIDLASVIAVGMYEKTVLSIEVRHLLAPMHEPQPVEPEEPEKRTLTVHELMAGDPVRTEYNKAFDRWAEIQRYRAELARQDAQQPVRPYRARVKS